MHVIFHGLDLRQKRQRLTMLLLPVIFHRKNGQRSRSDVMRGSDIQLTFWGNWTGPSKASIPLIQIEFPTKQTTVRSDGSFVPSALEPRKFVSS
jgi:hypothetical protein